MPKSCQSCQKVFRNFVAPGDYTKIKKSQKSCQKVVKKLSKKLSKSRHTYVAPGKNNGAVNKKVQWCNS
jgi:hypothetical protein